MRCVPTTPLASLTHPPTHTIPYSTIPSSLKPSLAPSISYLLCPPPLLFFFSLSPIVLFAHSEGAFLPFLKAIHTSYLTYLFLTAPFGSRGIDLEVPKV